MIMKVLIRHITYPLISLYIHPIVTFINLVTPCTDRPIVFYSLFTPYGYKFESSDGSGRIYEQYRDNSVEWPQRNPWKFVEGGYINVADQALKWIEREINVWSSVVTTGTTTVYYLARTWGLYSSYFSNRLYGQSVLRKMLIICRNIYIPFYTLWV